jgi:TRAP-type C4-dicarboxylate transport system permease small subunit
LTSNRTRGLLFAALALAFVLRIDLWFWDDPSLVLGLPVGLTYHALYCVAVAGLMALVVRFVWKPQADEESEREAER